MKSEAAVAAVAAAVDLAQPSCRHLTALRRYQAAVQQWTVVDAAQLRKQPDLALPIFTARPPDKKMDFHGYRSWIRGIQDRAERQRSAAVVAVCAAILEHDIPPLAPAKEES